MVVIEVEVLRSPNFRKITVSVGGKEYTYRSEAHLKKALPILSGFMYVIDMAHPDKVADLGYKLIRGSAIVGGGGEYEEYVEYVEYIFNVDEENLYYKNGNILELVNLLAQE